ncbi:DUF2946 family protein [Ramlibacter sp. PS3R-8]|uniref:DUF2946 family protein n=1 Tax=Ramlibacter sp. PS3R-8 TaxID=3133437 RepID=UPI0030A4769B
MHSLRRARHLAAMALAWFVLSLGIAVMAPALAGPALFDDICSVDSARAADGQRHSGSGPDHVVHCPACLNTAAPPPVDAVAVVHMHAPASGLPLAAQPAPHQAPPAPWTARGPPFLS